MSTGLFSVAKVGEEFHVVEGSRSLQSFGTRKGLAESYANRLNKANKPSGYDPKVEKAKRPAPKPKAPKPVAAATPAVPVSAPAMSPVNPAK